MKIRDKYCNKHPHFSKLYKKKICVLDVDKEYHLFSLLNQYREVMKTIDIEKLLLTSESNREFYERLLEELSVYFAKQFLKQELVLSQKLFINKSNFLDFYLKKIKKMLASLFLNILISKEDIKVFKKFITVTISKYNSRKDLLDYLKKIEKYQKEQLSIKKIKNKHLIIENKMFVLCSGNMLKKVPLTWCIFDSPVSWAFEERENYHVLVYDFSKSIFDKNYIHSIYFKKESLSFSERAVDSLNKIHFGGDFLIVDDFNQNIEQSKKVLPSLVNNDVELENVAMKKIIDIKFLDYHDFVKKFNKKYKQKTLPLKLIKNGLKKSKKEKEMDIYYFLMNKITSKQFDILMATHKFTETDLNQMSASFEVNSFWKKIIKNNKSFEKNVDK